MADKWEYKIIKLFSLAHIAKNEVVEDAVRSNADTLRLFGLEGWELVSVDNGIAYFKRPTEPIEFSGRLIRDVKGHPFKFTVRLGKENDD